jgi:hypothetical protein
LLNENVEEMRASMTNVKSETDLMNRKVEKAVDLARKAINNTIATAASFETDFGTYLDILIELFLKR